MRLAVIGTFYGRHENAFPLMHRLFVDATRKPDEAWLMCEGHADASALGNAMVDLAREGLIDPRRYPPDGTQILVKMTPKDENGRYSTIPYSNKINWALDRVQADAVVYLDNGSMPGPQKYEVMLAALEQNPDWGAVYCTQKRTGFNPEVSYAEEVVPDAFCRLNYTQVMHRVTEDRWPTDMRHANPDLADGLFWRSLHESLGPFHPAGGRRIHDDHHIPSPSAVGV